MTIRSQSTASSLFKILYWLCGEGGIAQQLCGWTVTWELCTGGIDDSAYVKTVNIFELQQEFAAFDRTGNNPFTNIVDHGYRVILEALMHGKQLCVQPCFASSDAKFSTRNVIYSAGIAMIRSGNERSVRQVKMSWLIKRGCVFQHWDFDILCDVWLAWAGVSG